MVSRDGECHIYVSLSFTQDVFINFFRKFIVDTQVISVANFINNLLRISLEHICGNTF